MSAAATRGELPTAPTATSSSAILGEKMPPLEELVAKVPESVRRVLDDLFRARFTSVRRISPDSTAN